MKIAIDVTALLPESTGVDRYITELVLHLAKIDSSNQYMIYHNYEDRKVFTRKLPGNFSLRSICFRPRPARLCFQQVILPIAASAWRADVVHSPSFIMPYIRGSARHVLTIHDMTAFSHPSLHEAIRGTRPYQTMVRASLRRADAIAVPSAATKQGILEIFPELNAGVIHVTALGVSDEFQLIDTARVEEVKSRLGLARNYILAVGTIEPRKNMPGLLESYRRLIEASAISENLVLVGKLSER